jgi:hypothetical protein
MNPSAASQYAAAPTAPSPRRSVTPGSFWLRAGGVLLALHRDSSANERGTHWSQYREPRERSGEATRRCGDAGRKPRGERADAGEAGSRRERERFMT